MSDFQPVRRRGHQAQPTIKYADQYQKLTEMGFESSSASKALEAAQGNLEAATIILLGEDRGSDNNNTTTSNEEEYEEKEVKRNQPNNSNSNNSNANNNSNTHKNTDTTANQLPKDVKEAHHKMMATYKVLKCKEAPNHDRRVCIYWHSLSDRRRNPFEYNYSCFDCPNINNGGDCKDGDNCAHSHTMLEKMFHPELFKISMCQRTLKGDKCDRGALCAFAHNESDLRIIPQPSGTAKPVDWKLPTRPIPESAKLNAILEKIVVLIKESGPEGAYGTDIAKKYSARYGEPLEIEDEKQEKYKFRDVVGSHPFVSIVFTRGAPPKYVYDESKPVETNDGNEEASKQATSAPVVEEENKASESQPSNSVRDRLVQVIKSCGTEGILGSDLPKKYLEMFGEKLDVTDESGSKIKLKDLLSAQTGVTIQMLKLQPKYVYEAVREQSSSSATTSTNVKGPLSYSSIAGTSLSSNSKNSVNKEVSTPPVAPAQAPSVAIQEKPLPPASVVVSGKSYSSVAKSFAKAVEVTKPQITHHQQAPVSSQSHNIISQQDQQQEEETEVQNNISSALNDLVDESAPSSEDPIFTQDNNTHHSLDRGIVESSPPDYSDVTFGSAFVSFGSAVQDNGLIGSHDEGSSLLRKPNESSTSAPTTAAALMGAPGLTKIHSQANSGLDATPSLASLIASGSSDYHERLNHAQSQITSLQQQINKLTNELTARNNEHEAQSAQLRAVMQRLAEAENKANNDEHFKHQLKTKNDEIAQKSRDLAKVEEESRKIRDERKADLNQFFINLSQIDDAIQAMKCKEESYQPDKIRPDDIQELLQFKKALRTFTASLKLQLKAKFDQILVEKPSLTSSLDTSVTANSLTAGGVPSGGIIAGSPATMAAPRYVPNSGYDPSGYYVPPRTDAFASTYIPYPPPVETGLCALPGCKSQGHYTCAGCQRVSYCGAEHQRLHWVQHSMNCHP